MLHARSRREFLKAALAAGTAVPAAVPLLTRSLAAKPPRDPNERLNLGIIGVAARGGANLAAVASENVVVLCDVDAARLGHAAGRFPRAKTCDDYRRVFDQKHLDGVVISTPDHMHAIPTSTALRNGLAVYCEKPLTHSVYEARYIRKLTAEAGCVTQMGNQIHNHPSGNYRRVVETIRAGVIGPVRRVHVWMEGASHFVIGKRVDHGDPPPGINYDGWIGPAPYRPFHPSHFHFQWRYWWDFGGGQLADFWCHFCDLPFWALGLEQPERVHARGKKGHHGDNDCPRQMQVEYHFPGRDARPPVHLTWYHGGPMPPGAEIYKKHTAVLFEGENGRLLADYTTRKLFMNNGRRAASVAESIPSVGEHHQEWIHAIKTNNPNTTCNFRYGGLLTEVGLLGNVSYRAGQKQLDWDATALRARNCPDADPLIRIPYRRGWKLA